MVFGEAGIKELREEVIQLRHEVNRISQAILDQRIESIENVLTEKHLKLYNNQVSEIIEGTVGRCVNPECSKKNECVTKFNAELKAVFDSVETRSMEDVFNGIQVRLARIQEFIDESGSKPCAVCHSNLRDLIVDHEKNLRQIVGVEPQGESREIQIDLLIETVLKPLSHPARLRILVALGRGSAGFSELSEVTDMRGGHLLFHLEQLVDSGLVTQSGRKGEYIISERGLDSLKKIAEIPINK